MMMLRICLFELDNLIFILPGQLKKALCNIVCSYAFIEVDIYLNDLLQSGLEVQEEMLVTVSTADWMI